MGVIIILLASGSTIGPPADMEYAVEPVGVAITAPSPVKDAIALSSPKSSRVITLLIPFMTMSFRAKSSNMVALGAVIKTLDILTLEDAKDVIAMKMKPELVEANVRALEAGYNFK